MGLLGMQFHLFSNECKIFQPTVFYSLSTQALPLEKMLTVNLGQEPDFDCNFKDTIRIFQEAFSQGLFREGQKDLGLLSMIKDKT